MNLRKVILWERFFAALAAVTIANTCSGIRPSRAIGQSRQDRRWKWLSHSILRCHR